jgi:riboflavin kinase / FMN adenylyltransferase
MIITENLHDLQTRERPIVLAAGFFDGVHIGHQSVILHAIRNARARDGEAWVMTFAPHPMKILKPEIAPRMLTANVHKLALLQAHGVDGAIVLPFTRELAATCAGDFARWLFHCAPSLAQIVVGENWRFGTRASGTPALLAELGRESGVSVQTMPPVLHAGEPVSSTRIREAIQHGELEIAAAMLGRPPGILGTVIPGRAIGRTLGFPSANIDPHHEALPPQGIYAVEARIDDQFYPGALSYGTRPTFDGNDPSIKPVLELHLIDFTASLYGKNIETFLLKRLRDQWQFPSTEALIAQIARDVADTRAIVASHGLTTAQKSFFLSSTHHL